MCILRDCLNCQIDWKPLSEPSVFQTFRLCPIVQWQHSNDQTPHEPGLNEGVSRPKPLLKKFGANDLGRIFKKKKEQLERLVL
jgi:hypothetical protein